MLNWIFKKLGSDEGIYANPVVMNEHLTTEKGEEHCPRNECKWKDITDGPPPFDVLIACITCLDKPPKYINIIESNHWVNEMREFGINQMEELALIRFRNWYQSKASFSMNRMEELDQLPWGPTLIKRKEGRVGRIALIN